MELEKELNKRRAAPADFWISFVLLAIAAIIAFFLLNNDRRSDQRNTEKKTTFLKIEAPAKPKTESYGKSKI